MLLQVNLGNIREQIIICIWENSPVLAQLRQRESLKGGGSKKDNAGIAQNIDCIETNKGLGAEFPGQNSKVTVRFPFMEASLS